MEFGRAENLFEHSGMFYCSLISHSIKGEYKSRDLDLLLKIRHQGLVFALPRHITHEMSLTNFKSLVKTFFI